MSSSDESDPVQARRTAALGRGQALLAGTSYRFVAPLGQGGMGEVVEAEHVALGKRVVVKLIHAQLAKRPDLVDRMRVEAQALGRLDHPNLVAVSDFGKTGDGRPFLVMERLYGRNLREELKARGALPVAEAVDIVRQALAALGASHEIGIVHRDVKLDNLFLCDLPQADSGRERAADGDKRKVKLLDFGIAKVVGDAQGRAPAPLAFPTEEGVAVGTPRFFSPEQARGEKVDGRTDVYAVGVVLYTLVAGRGPFDHINALFELTRAHATEVPHPPSRYAAQAIPPELDAAIMKALEKRADARWPTASAFAERLGEIAEALSVRQSKADRPEPAPAAAAVRSTIRMPERISDPPAAREPIAGGVAVAAEPHAASLGRDALTERVPSRRRGSSFAAFAVVIVMTALVSAGLVALILSRLG